MRAALSVFILALCCCAYAQNVPTVWPLTWHSWVVTTVKAADSQFPTYNEGRLVMFDNINKVACRYWEQNLVNQSTARRADYCDYSAQLHYIMNDTKPDSVCSGVEKVSDGIDRISFSQDFVNTARFLGVNNVSQKECNHFYAPAIKVGEGQYVQMDVWVDVSRGLPCQVSTLDLRSQEIITWAFDGFDTTIPHQAIQQCSIPRIFCGEDKWVCQAKRNANPGGLGQALGWVCSTGGVNCAPINPGGSNFYPDTLIAHCDWAFNSYFRQHRYNQGIDACDFANLGELVPPTPTPPPPVIPSKQHADVDVISFLKGMSGAFATVIPFDVACSNPSPSR